MPRFVAILIDGNLTVHGQPADGNFDTLCGLDAEDGSVGHSPRPWSPGMKINCHDCRAIWLAAQQIHARDFV